MAFSLINVMSHQTKQSTQHRKRNRVTTYPSLEVSFERPCYSISFTLLEGQG